MSKFTGARTTHDPPPWTKDLTYDEFKQKILWWQNTTSVDPNEWAARIITCCFRDHPEFQKRLQELDPDTFNLLKMTTTATFQFTRGNVTEDDSSAPDATQYQDIDLLRYDPGVYPENGTDAEKEAWLRRNSTFTDRKEKEQKEALSDYARVITPEEV